MSSFAAAGRDKPCPYSSELLLLMMNQPTRQPVASRFRGLVIIWGAQVFSLAILFLVALVVPSPARGEMNQTLLLALAAAGLACVGLSFVVKSILVARAAAERRADVVTTAYILAFALCEACAILGMVLRFATGAREGLYFFAAAALGFLLNFPRRRHVEDATGDQGQTFDGTFKTTL
jgi:F0F1-type ATP synthase membrane subunit c/vacuolar-type H+-ATPase subunit K